MLFRSKKTNYQGKAIQSFSELSVGDYVVHEEHGLSLIHILQSDFGKVTVKKIKVETDAGLTMGGLLYVPDSATEENPAPAAVVVHGWWKTKES